MKLSKFKNELSQLHEVKFILPNGIAVPTHFHVTEVGIITKNYIDCGGEIRKDTVVGFQLWEDKDVDHRLAPSKLLKIIALSEAKLGITDAEIEVEYQSDTIGKYGVEYNNGVFILTNTFTDCLAKDKCGVEQPKQKVQLADLSSQTSCCNPKSGCC